MKDGDIIAIRRPKFSIDEQVMFNDPQGDLAIVGKVTGARYVGDKWMYTVYSQAIDTSQPELYTAAEDNLAKLGGA